MKSKVCQARTRHRRCRTVSMYWWPIGMKNNGTPTGICRKKTTETGFTVFQCHMNTQIVTYIYTHTHMSFSHCWHFFRAAAPAPMTFENDQRGTSSKSWFRHSDIAYYSSEQRSSTHPIIPRAYWKLLGRHGHPPCFPTSFAWYLFMLYVDALLSLVLPFLRVGLKVFSTGKLLFDVLLSLDFVSELLPLFACCCCCCWSSCCCWYSISLVSQMLDQMRFASPSCSSWYQATAKSMINHHNRLKHSIVSCFFFAFFCASVSLSQMNIASLTHSLPTTMVSRFFTN